jgi:SAM-dependent methyltransferase
MTAGTTAVLDLALREARRAAFGAEFVGQESFVTASEVLSLARRAGVAPGVSVLDLCCGTGGPGLSVTRTLGCDYLGVDADPRSVAEARGRAAAELLDARFEVARVPPVPPGSFDVVLLLETMLAFRDKPALLRGVSAALRTGGRFAFTLEEGAPLTDAERGAMPGSDTVWLTPLEHLLADLEAAGLWVHWLGECSQQHRAAADALLDAYTASASHLDEVAGSGAVDDLVTSHRLWSRWLQEGRVRKFAIVADKVRS